MRLVGLVVVVCVCVVCVCAVVACEQRGGQSERLERACVVWFEGQIAGTICGALTH